MFTQMHDLILDEEEKKKILREVDPLEDDWYDRMDELDNYKKVMDEEDSDDS